MANQLEIYHCKICGNIVEVVHGGAGALVCCGQNMDLLEAKGAGQEGKEKHVPVIEKEDGVITVKVGSNLHPMVEEHHIEWVEILADGKAYRQFLNAGEEPKAVFHVSAEKVTAREHCNLHGLWSAEA